MKHLIVKVIAILLLIFFIGWEAPKESLEEMGIPSSISLDIEKKGKDEVTYEVIYNAYNYEEEKKITSSTIVAEERTVSQGRSERQLKSNKKFLIGLEKVIVFSEEYAQFGMKTAINVLFGNPSINDTAFLIVCKGQTRAIIEHTIPGYPSSADYMEGMIREAKDFNFFTDNYKLIDIFVRMDSEGRSITLPYIELKNENEGLKITGIALFNKDKMVGMLPLKDAKILNLLSAGSGKGLITIQESPNIYVDYYAKAKRKVSCKKESNKYIFNIDIDLKGDIISNEYNKNLQKDVKVKEDLEKNLAAKIEEMCKEVLKVMQNQYKCDFLELGRVAAAKYGRDTGTDWNEVVANSIIKVKVKAKIDKQGRGDY